MTHSTDVTWLLDGITMEGTVVCPDGDGPFPAVVFVAGSGPTDRDWCSPLLSGTNGSARLLAQSFADAGVASLRYDKRASGPHASENVAKLVGKMSMQSHLNELVAAVTTLTQQDYVDSSKVVGFGHSEGTLHVLHYATTAQTVPFMGIVLAAPPGRPIHDVLLAQLGAQADQFGDYPDLMRLVREAATRYAAGEDMKLDPSLPDSVKTALSSFEAPANLPFARELWVESASSSLGSLQIPALVMIGAKDSQVDMIADGIPLREAAAGMPDVTFSFPANANHVFKKELRHPAEIVASPGSGYNEPGACLDPESVATIVTWLSGAASNFVTE